MKLTSSKLSDKLLNFFKVLQNTPYFTYQHNLIYRNYMYVFLLI